MNPYTNPVTPPSPKPTPSKPVTNQPVVQPSSKPIHHEVDSNRLEIVIACVGFDDVLDVTLANNISEVDTVIVVTTHDDRRTHGVAQKHGAIVVPTDLFFKNGRHFNKGAALNAGFGHFQYHGWRAVVDADIAFPSNFRRMLFNHTHLEKDSIYGVDRVDLVGKEEIGMLNNKRQHIDSYFVHSDHHRPVSHRYVDHLYGYVPIGFYQMWHAKTQKPYPYSLGTAAHDDILFATQWPNSHRHLIQTSFVYHLCAQEPSVGENWDGHRKQPRIDE